MHAPLVTLRSVAQAAEGLGPLLADTDGVPAVRVPERGLGGRLAAVVDGAPCPGAGAGAGAPAVDLARGALAARGVATSPKPLDPAQLGRAAEVFEAVEPLRAAPRGPGRRPAVATGDDVRSRLAQCSRGGRGGVDEQLAEVLGA